MIETKKMRLYLYISALSRSASTTKRTLLSQFNVLSHKVNQKCHNYKVKYQILLQILPQLYSIYHIYSNYTIYVIYKYYNHYNPLYTSNVCSAILSQS